MISIGIKEFQTQKDAEIFVRITLLSLEGVVIDKNEKEWDFLNELIKMHPESNKKRGDGIKHFKICRSAFGHIELNLFRVDGSKSDISWKKCISQLKSSSLQDLKSAMRAEINYQIKIFKKNNFFPENICQLCHQPLSTEDIHVDHIFPFDKLVELFLKKNPFYPKRFSDELETNRKNFRKEDKEYANSWSEYHLKIATLRLVHARCNLARKRVVT